MLSVTVNCTVFDTQGDRFNRLSLYKRLRSNLNVYKSESYIARLRFEPLIVKMSGRIGCSAQLYSGLLMKSRCVISAGKFLVVACIVSTKERNFCEMIHLVSS